MLLDRDKLFTFSNGSTFCIFFLTSFFGSFLKRCKLHNGGILLSCLEAKCGQSMKHQLFHEKKKNPQTYPCKCDLCSAHTSAVNEHISIKSIPEENYILLIFEIDVSPCKEMRVKAETTE